MAQSIHTNVAALNALRSTTRSQGDAAMALGRLSSGLRINSARDDAAGMAIADRMTAQTRGLSQAARNANDGISLAQTAEGALVAVGNNLQRIRELAVQSANATNSASDRAALQLEVAQLVSEIDRVASQTAFNGIKLLDGSFAASKLQVGANVGETITMGSIASTRSSALGIYQGVHYESPCGLINSNAPSILDLTIGSGPTIILGSIPVDAKIQADLIAASNIPGLSARAFDTVVGAAVSTASASAAGVATLTLNGVAIAIGGVNGAAALTGNRAAAVAAINARSAVTGVVATDTGAGVGLLAADGRNIAMAYSAGSFAGSNEGDFGLWASGGQIMVGQQIVDYVAPAGVTGNLTWTIAGIPAPHPIGTVGTPLAAIDIGSANGASGALASIDAALASVSSVRAALGATQNRFSSTVASLRTTGANAAAARSRIQDADFAQETASLSRAQVLQEAGTAMIAQANQSPKQVLELLR